MRSAPAITRYGTVCAAHPQGERTSGNSVQAKFAGLPFHALGRMVPKGEAEPGVRQGPHAPASRGPAALHGGPGSTPASPGGPPIARGSGSRGTSPSARNGHPPNRSCKPGPSSGRETPFSPVHPMFASCCSSIGLRLDATLAGRGSEGGSPPPRAKVMGVAYATGGARRIARKG